MSFDWQTGEKEWETEQAESAETSRPPPEKTTTSRFRRLTRWRVWLVAGVVLLLAGALVAVIIRQVNRRAAAAVVAVEAEVTAAQETVIQAATGEDVELFRFLLSGRDIEWGETQEQLIDDGQFFDRSGIGFTWVAEGRAAEVASITLDPQLQRAEVMVNEQYVVQPGANVTETVKLQQTAVYRRGPDRWLYSPPEPEFWGETMTVHASRLVMTFPARDNDVVRRLLPDLSQVMTDLCTSLGDYCPEQFAPHLTLSTDPASLLEVDNPLQRWTASAEITLPSVTLIGRPLDETGYQVLYRDYASRLVSSAITELTGWTCCAHSLYYGTFMAAQLEALGLREWPDTSESFQAVIQDPQFASQEMQAFWRSGGIDPAPHNVMPAYALAEFLIEEGSPLSLYEMQRMLVRNPGLPFWTWLQDATGGRYRSLNDFQRNLLGYALERVPVNAPIAPPNDDLQLACLPTGPNQQAALYRYDPATDVLDRERGLSGTSIIGGLPDDQGVVVAMLPTAQTDGSTFIWRDGKSTQIVYPVLNNRSTPLIPLPIHTPGDIVPLLAWDMAAPPYARLALEQCQAGESCPAQTLLGQPLWSPDGARSLLSVEEPRPVDAALTGGRRDALILLADSVGRQATSLEVGKSPFWLNDGSVGYVLPYSGPGGQAVVLRRPETNGELSSAVRVLFDTSRLLAATESPNGGGLHIDQVIVSPTYAEQMMVITADTLGTARVSYLLAYDFTEDKLAVRHRLATEPLSYQRGYQLSPNGRWLLIASLVQPEVSGVYQPTWRIYLHDIPNNHTRELEMIVPGEWPAHWFVDWSADGQWLSLVSNGYLRLIPLDDEPLPEWPVVLDGLGCHSAIWVMESAAAGLRGNTAEDSQ